jgi:hypothetical protein
MKILLEEKFRFFRKLTVEKIFFFYINNYDNMLS